MAEDKLELLRIIGNDDYFIYLFWFIIAMKLLQKIECNFNLWNFKMYEKHKPSSVGKHVGYKPTSHCTEKNRAYSCYTLLAWQATVL